MIYSLKKKNLLGGTKGTVKIEVTPNKIIKTYYRKSKASRRAFENELKVYKLAKSKRVKFIPKLLDYDLVKKRLVIENVGISLDKLIKKDKTLKEKFLPKIKKVYDKFVRIFKLYHNDLRYKNIVYDEKKDKLYLIDFEFTHSKFDNKNHQGIVAKISKKNKNKN